MNVALKYTWNIKITGCLGPVCVCVQGGMVLEGGGGGGGIPYHHLQVFFLEGGCGVGVKKMYIFEDFLIIQKVKMTRIRYISIPILNIFFCIYT